MLEEKRAAQLEQLEARNEVIPQKFNENHLGKKGPSLYCRQAAARAAGKIMRDNRHPPKHVNSAEAHDIKLELDVRCQKLIEKIFFAAFPQVALLGEEGCSGDADAEYRWVVDPIDGTVNYFFGMPHAAVSIALQRRNENIYETVLGVIYDPFTDELWTATLGGKTRLNGCVVRVSKRRHSWTRLSLRWDFPRARKIWRRACLI